jgi:hypothetical protein
MCVASLLQYTHPSVSFWARRPASPVCEAVFSCLSHDTADRKSSNYEDGVIKSLITWQDDMVSDGGGGSSGGAGLVAAGASAGPSGAAGRVAECLPCKPAAAAPARL